jgi:hypothetical protein
VCALLESIASSQRRRSVGRNLVAASVIVARERRSSPLVRDSFTPIKIASASLTASGSHDDSR